MTCYTRDNRRAVCSLQSELYDTSSDFYVCCDDASYINVSRKKCGLTVPETAVWFQDLYFYAGTNV